MNARSIAGLALLCLAVGPSAGWGHPPEFHVAQNKQAKPAADFVYDPADATVNGTVLDNKLFYDADVLARGDTLWLAWLEFTPEKGDRIWVGVHQQGDWAARTLVTETHASYAAPTLTLDAQGTVWLSYEAEREKQWDVLAVRLENGQPQGDPRRISPGKGSDIRHRAAAAPDGSVWFVWQSDQDGQFEILARPLAANQLGDVEYVSKHPRGDWHPAVAAGKDGSLYVAWDSFDGESFNVHLRARSPQGWQAARVIAGTPAFEGRAQLAVDSSDRLWIAWEEGGDNWGRPYRGIQTPTLRDEHGPLHRFRRLHVASVDKQGQMRVPAQPLPLPALQSAGEREGKIVKRTGAFYERPKLAVDGQGRIWVAYRHFYAPWLGFVHRSHVEQGWGVYARYLASEGWSKLYRFDVDQGDGLQRLELSPSSSGIAAVWTTGRTDRRKNNRPRGIVLASVAADGPAVKKLDLAEAAPAQPLAKLPPPDRRRDKAEIGGKKYQLFYGDLHRHTDLSLCRVPIDGTIDDAYRYASDVARLDFLGITDHSRDIDRGDALSQLWWRSRKEVYRHQLGTQFLPFFAYERSHGNTADHNVISLKPDMLRPHTYPVPQFWKELDENTITIPHQPIRRDTWKYQDDKLRPLVEIFQGCRDNAIEEHVHRGLEKGYHLGFIASSDHMSTSSSYACVWAEDASRQSIFAALKARRTYAATTKIRLTVQAGDHWMGETIAVQQLPPLKLHAQGTAPIRLVQVVVDGKPHKSLTPNERQVDLTVPLDLTGEHYVYFYLRQADGNEAWSSPIWLTAGEQAGSKSE